MNKRVSCKSVNIFIDLRNRSTGIKVRLINTRLKSYAEEKNAAKTLKEIETMEENFDRWSPNCVAF